MTGGSWRRIARALLLALALPLVLAGSGAFAGGPRVHHVNGSPMQWPTTSPVAYQVDRGRLGTVANDQAVRLLEEAFGSWSAVPTTSISFQRTALLPVDVTEQNWSLFFGVGGDGRSPVIFDADGRILDQLLGLTARNDFEGVSRIELSSGAQIVEAAILINGSCFDGISDERSPCELRGLDELRALLLHEAGHFCNLDHSSLNHELADDGDPANNAVLPTMYPLHTEDDATFAVLNMDDRLALSSLYPRPPFPGSGGSIEGRVLGPASTPLDGANVTARNLEDPFLLAATRISGAEVSAGYYRFTGLPPGNYTVEVAPVPSAFVGRFSVGQPAQSGSPVRLPGPREFFGAAESADPASDDPQARSIQVVLAGATLTGRDIIMNNMGGLADNQAGGNNNTCLLARLLPESGGTVGDRIEAGDVDYFKLFLRAGWKVFIDLDAADPDMNSSLVPRVGLFRQVGPLCQEITTSATVVPDPASGEMLADPAYEYTPSATEHLIVAVASEGDTAFSGSGGTSAGPYYLRVTPQPPAVASQASIGSGGGEASGGSGSSAIGLLGGFPGTVGAPAEDPGGTIISRVVPPLPLPDADGDGLPDVVDPCPASPDGDADGVCDVLDNCTAAVNAAQADGDDDGAGDACDAPAVMAVAPTENSFSVALASSIEIRFSEPMDVASLQAGGSPGAVGLTGPGGVPVMVTRSISPDGTSVTLDPVAALAPGTLYSLNVASSVVDLDIPPRPITYSGATFRTVGSSTRPTVAVDDIGPEMEGSSSQGSAAGDLHGAALSAAGDADADGFSDVLIGTPMAQGGAGNSGKVLLRLGDPGAVAGTSLLTIEFAGESSGDMAGRSVAFTGDVSGDGIGDLLIGAPGASPVGGADRGAAYLVFGEADWSTIASPVALGSIGLPGCVASGPCGIVLRGDDAGDQAGAAVSFAGDVNHDGKLDLLIGAPGRTVRPLPSDVRNGAGAVYLVFGGAALQVPGAIALSDVGGGIPGVVFLGENAGDAAGSALSDWRDRTMDGVDDLLIGSPGAIVLDSNGTPLADAGLVHSLRGAAGMPSGAVDLRGVGLSVTGTVLMGATAGARAGASLSGHYDVTGDGEFDALIGAPGMSFVGRSQVGAGVLAPSTLTDPIKTPLKARGAGWICVGSPVPGTPPPAQIPAAPRSLIGCADAASNLEATLFMGEATGDEAGAALSGAGDVNGDGVEEILLGAPGADAAPDPNFPIIDAGRAYLILGQSFRTPGPAPLDAVGTSQPGVVFEGRTALGRLGAALAGGGDVDGSLSTEILLAAPGDPTAPPDSGRVFIAAPYVAGLPRDVQVAGGIAMTIEWTRAVGAVRHRVYRGPLGSLRTDGGVHTAAAACLTPGGVADGDADMDGRPDFTDTTVPVVGDGFWYLMTGVNLLGEGTPGTDSAGRLRFNDSPCM